MRFNDAELGGMSDERLAKEMANAKLEYDAADAQLEEMKREYRRRRRDELGDYEHEDAGVRVKLQPNRRFDLERAEQILTDEEKARFTRPMLDRELIKKGLSPEDYSALCKEYDPKVKIEVLG